MSYNLATATGHLRDVLAKTVRGSVESSLHRRVHYVGGKTTSVSLETPQGTVTGALPPDAGPSFSIVDEGTEALDAAVGELLKDVELEECVGEKAIEEQLVEVVRQALDRPELLSDADILKEAVVRPLRQGIRRWTVYVPILNMEVRQQLPIGDAISFISRPQGLATIGDYCIKHEYGGDTDLEKSIHRLMTVSAVLTTNAAAFVTIAVRAHGKFATKVADATTATAVNALRAFVPLFAARKERSWFGLPAESPGGIEMTWALSQDEHEGMRHHRRDVGFNFPFVVDERVVRHLMERCQFAAVVSILRVPPKSWTSMDRAIVAGLMALGRSVAAQRTDDSFLLCVMAIERLLLSNGEEATSERFGDRIALLLGRSAEERVNLQRQAKRHYDLRSVLVHQAGFSVVEEEHRHNIEQMALAVLIALLGERSAFSEHGVFCKAINDRKFTS